jgi:hypothetical protein
MTTVLDHPKADFWKRELDSGIPYRAATAAKEVAEEFSSSETKFTITVCDAFWREIGKAGGFIEVSGTIPRNAAPQATLKLPENHWLDPYLSECENTMVGVIIETEGISEAFYVKRHREKLDEDGKVTLTSELVGIWDILNYLPIWPSWYLPIATQPFSHAIYFGPLCTVIEAMAAEQAFRIQGGMFELPNNLLSLNPDFRAWIGTMLQRIENEGQNLHTPLYVVRTGLLTDASPLFCRTVRMETVGQVITDITQAYGVDVRISLWLPGMPQPDKYANLEQPTYVMTVKDRSQIEGPTKTILDSALRFAIDAQGSLLGKTLDPLLNPDGEYAPEGVYIAPKLGLVFVPPYAQMETPDTIVADGEVVRSKSALMTYEIVRTTPLGWQHVIGGKSPKWLNDLMNAFYAYVIDVAQIILGFTGVPSNLLDGFLNDAFFAFQLIQHYSRRDDVGPYHPAIEVFTATNSSPYNIESLFQIIQVLWDSRGYTTAVCTFRGQNGPFKLGRDIFPGALFTLVYSSRTKMFTDHIELVSFKANRSTREVSVTVGDGKPIQHPIVELKRNVSETIAAVNVATLAPNS